MKIFLIPCLTICRIASGAGDAIVKENAHEVD